MYHAMVEEWDQAETRRAESRTRRRKVALLVTLPLLALIAATLILAVDLSHVHFGYGTSAAKYQAAGLPWTAEDLVPQQIPNDQNAYLKYEELFEEWKALGKNTAPSFKKLINPSDYSTIEAFLAPRNKILDRSKQISKMDCVWLKDWDKGPDLLLPELAYFKEVVKVLILRAEYHSARRNFDLAAEDLAAASRMSVQIGRGPTLIHGLVQIACRSITFRGLERSASFHLTNASALEKYSQAIEPLSQPPSLAYAYRGEAFTNLAFLRNFQWKAITPRMGTYEEDGPYLNPEKFQRGGEVKGFIARSFAVPILDHWTKASEQMAKRGLGPKEMMEISSGMMESVEKSKGLSSTVLKIMTPVYDQAAKAYAKTEVDFVIAKTGMTLAISNAAGTAVANFQIPGDPLADAPLKIENSKGVTKVWSVGLNGKDDGGISSAEFKALRRPNTVGEEDSDLVFRLPYENFAL